MSPRMRTVFILDKAKNGFSPLGATGGAHHSLWAKSYPGLLEGKGAGS